MINMNIKFLDGCTIESRVVELEGYSTPYRVRVLFPVQTKILPITIAYSTEEDMRKSFDKLVMDVYKLVEEL
jgi:hypothetical protein